jgi:hypothetical protein
LASYYKKSMFDVTRTTLKITPGTGKKWKGAARYQGPEKESYDSVLKTLEAGFKHQEALERGCMWVMDQIEHVPVQPIEAGEKGLKTRFPTCSLTACNLMQQMLRRVIDHLLINDPRMSECFGGERLSRFKATHSFYSQDMSFATDLHPHWLTREVYEVLVPFDVRLEKFLPYFDRLFGPKRLVLLTTGRSFPLDQIDYAFASYNDEEKMESGWDVTAPMLPTELRAIDPDWVRTRATVRGRVPVKHIHKCMCYLREYQDWLLSLSSPAVGPLTTVGAMMGDPTSFPVMPLMSAFAAKVAGHNRYDGMLTGDDAAFSGFRKSQVAPYERAMAQLGGVISSKKTEWHQDKALFCEAPFVRGKRQKFTFLSNWVAPPGGSKGEVNWVNQSLTVVQQNHAQGMPRTAGLWEYSPLWRMQQAAYLLGLPIGAEPGLGGNSHPKFPCTSVKWHRQWVGYLATMTSAELISGAGLAIFPSPYQDMRLKAAQFVEGEIERQQAEVTNYPALLVRYMEAGGDPKDIPAPQPICVSQPYTAAGTVHQTLVEACDAAAAPLISSSLYFRAPVEIKHAPSIQRAARKFFFKIKKASPVNYRYLDVRDELLSRSSKYVTTGLRLPPTRRTIYGLGAAAPVQRVRLRHWAEGRIAFR